MRDWLKEGIDDLIAEYKKDVELIGGKNKDIEWKRDHYRNTSTVLFQRILNLLQGQVTAAAPAPLQQSTKTELIELKNIIDSMLS